MSVRFWRSSAVLACAVLFLGTASFASAQDSAINEALIGRPLVQPNLEINIPTVTFTPALQEDGKITVNWIGQYITGVYRYLLGIGVTIAIVMVMVGGLQYVLAAGGGDVKKGKKRITDAVTGLILLSSVYLILFTVAGPRLTTFNALTLKQVARIDYPAEAEPDAVQGRIATATGDATGDRADYFFEVDTWSGEVSNPEPHKCAEVRFFPLDALPENLMHHVRDALDDIARGVVYSELGPERTVKNPTA